MQFCRFEDVQKAKRRVKQAAIKINGELGKLVFSLDISRDKFPLGIIATLIELKVLNPDVAITKNYKSPLLLAF